MTLQKLDDLLSCVPAALHRPSPSMERTLPQIEGISGGYLAAPAIVLLSLICTIGWLSGVTYFWIHEAGDGYARALRACCDRSSK